LPDKEKNLTLNSIEITLWLACMAMEATLLVLLIRARVFRTLPVFFSCLVWWLCSDAPMMLVVRFFTQEGYQRFCVLNMTIDALFEFAILVELGWAVLRHNRAAPPRRYVLILLVTLATMVVWSLAKWTAPAGTTALLTLYVHLRQVITILRVALILALAWWSSLQRLSWPDQALRVATGVGFYSIVELVVSILHTHQNAGPQYHLLDELVTASYLGTLAYWVLSFSKKREKEQNFSLQT
jgi:hypothetical protein